VNAAARHSASASRSDRFAHSVTDIWQQLVASAQPGAESLTEEAFERASPGPDTVFVRVTDMIPEQLYAFRVKTMGYIADWRIDLSAVSAAETDITFSESVDYRSTVLYFLSGFGLMIRRELAAFSAALERKLASKRQ